MDVQDDSEANNYRQQLSSEQKMLVIKFDNNETIRYALPSALAKRKISHTFTNGILEVSLKKWKIKSH